MKRLFLGYDANRQGIHLSSTDRERHMHVIGSSGSGKSKFLEWMIRGDIKNRQGLCLIDPHGTLYEDIVKWTAYHNYLDRDIILLNPSDGDYVTGFNPFVKTEGNVSVRVDAQIIATIRAWGQENTDETPTLERWLRCIYQTLNERRESIVAAEYLIDFYEPEVREYLTSNLSQRMLRSEWQGISKLRTPRQFSEEMLSTRNRLLRFLCSEQICRFMGLRENNINLREIMNEGKILLVNLAPSGELSPENAKVFGTLLVNEIFQEAKKRERGKFGESPKPFYLYIDEFQEFVTPDIAYILDQSRKFGLHLILAHQRLGHLQDKYPDVLDAVLTNVKTRAVFGGLSREAAKLMVEEMFVNQLDLKQIKKAIFQTKFWPKYSRDKVYSSGTSHTESSTTSSVYSTGQATQWQMEEGWFGVPGPSTITENQGSASGYGSGYADTTSESVADAPIFIPVPFKELTSEEYWSLEEQIFKMSDALKSQFPRHCFIQIPGQKTQPMLVPFIKSYGVFEKTLIEYQQELYDQTYSLPVAEVDRLLDLERKRIKTEAMEYVLPSSVAEKEENFLEEQSAFQAIT